MSQIVTTAALQAYYNSLLQAKANPGLTATSVAANAFNQIVSDTNAGLIDAGIAAAFLVPLISPGLSDPNLAASFLKGLQTPKSTGVAITTSAQLAAYYQTLVNAKAAPGSFTVPSGAISGASNASPLVITTLAAHGLNLADIVIHAGVLGNTNANGTFAVASIPSPTTYTLYQLGNTTPIVGNAAYAGGGIFTRANANDQQTVGHTAGLNSAQASQVAAQQIIADMNQGLIAQNIAAPFLATLGLTVTTPTVQPSVSPADPITDSGTLQTYYNSLVAAKSSAGLNQTDVAKAVFSQVVQDTLKGLITPTVAQAFLIPLVPNATTAIATGIVNNLLGLS